MSYDAERRVLERHFDDAWLNGPYHHVPVGYENVPFVPPINQEPYLMFAIQSGPSDQISLGDVEPLVRHFGVLVVDVFSGEEEGTQENRALVDEIVNVLQRKSIYDANAGTIITMTANLTPFGVDGGYWHNVVTIPYERDEFPA